MKTTLFVVNQCYYCNQTFESRTDLYDHLVTHAKIDKTEKSDDLPKEEKQSEAIIPETRHIEDETEIDAIKKKVEEIQKRIQSA